MLTDRDIVARVLARDHLDAARADLLAFTIFPREIWRQIWSNNPLLVNRPSDDTFAAAA